MDIRYFSDLAQGPRLRLINWLQGRSFIPHPLRCALCEQNMEVKERNDDHIDGFLWYKL